MSVRSLITALSTAAAAVAAACAWAPAFAADYSVASPDRSITVSVSDRGGTCRYRVTKDGAEVIRPSALGFRFGDGIDLFEELSILSASRSASDTLWEQPWGEQRLVEDRHSELAVLCERADGRRRMLIVFRVFDDGVGFRYELPGGGIGGAFDLIEEKTEFALAGDHAAWWIPALENNRYEYLYTESPVSGAGTVHTPLTMRTSQGIYLSIHEAALTDWASMALASEAGNVLRCRLVPWSDGVAVRGTMPAVSPWRTITIAADTGGLVTSTLILNLNEPSRIADTSWIRP
ncbi:MAG: glycoside hydrolase family 97 N-terminal domain-containing protein, partial [Candidatus Krumholzibacteria bacterium]|nr:glycoside hydrolase family 97 N-terminal domain-containing protein [Candidatus Krumholzibacteria bacterium]